MRAMLFLVPVLLLHASAAQECVGTTSTTTPEHIVVEAAPYYIAFDVCQVHGCLFSIWIYQESNGIRGLQRGDDRVDDTCGGAAYESDSVPL